MFVCVLGSCFRFRFGLPRTLEGLLTDGGLPGRRVAQVCRWAGNAWSSDGPPYLRAGGVSGQGVVGGEQ